MPGDLSRTELGDILTGIDADLRSVADGGVFAQCIPKLASVDAPMMTSGHHDGLGEAAFRVGLPGQSGVGGGILSIATGKASVGELVAGF